MIILMFHIYVFMSLSVVCTVTFYVAILAQVSPEKEIADLSGTNLDEYGLN